MKAEFITESENHSHRRRQWGVAPLDFHTWYKYSR